MSNRSLIDITKDLVLAQNDLEMFQEEDLMKKVDEHIVELYNKEDATYYFYQQIESQKELGRKMEEKIKKSRKVMDAMQERIKQNIIGAFAATKHLPAHSDFNPIKISQSSGSVDVINEFDIPQEYFIDVVVQKLDKKRILEGLKNGEKIPGVRLVRKDYVRGIKQLVKKVKLGQRSKFPNAERIKKYWVFAPEFRNMNKYDRDRKASSLASNKGKCWWIKEWMTMYPNRILDKSRKEFDK